jgi:hypothetical protein
MYDDWIHSNQLHQDDIPSKTLVQKRVYHGIAAKLYNNGLASKSLYVGQSLSENLSNIECGVALE